MASVACAVTETEALTWKVTAARLREDRRRLTEMLTRDNDAPIGSVWMHPSFVCVFLYRVSNHLNHRGYRKLARLVWHLNAILTGADVSPFSELDAGLVILSPAGTAIMGRSGRNLTVMPCAGLGGEIGRWEDIGAGPGLPVIGNDVILEPHTGVLGPIRIGDRVRIGAGVVVTYDIPADTIIQPHPARSFHRAATS